MGGAETVDYIVSRSAATGEAYIPEQVHAVVETQLAYLRAIGAVGEVARPRPDDHRSVSTRDCFPDVTRAAGSGTKEDRRKEVVQQMHDKSGTLEVRGR